MCGSFSISINIYVLVLPQKYGGAEKRLFGEEADEFGGDFDGDGEELGEVDEEVATTGAAGFEQASFEAVKGAADYEDATSVHVGGYLVGAVVAGLLGGAHGKDEALHVDPAYGHGCAIAAAAFVTVL